jgi:hypothetical protein
MNSRACLRYKPTFSTSSRACPCSLARGWVGRLGSLSNTRDQPAGTKGPLWNGRRGARLTAAQGSWGDATVEAIVPDQNQTEIAPFEQICPRHGLRIRRYHGCPKCVIEEVRRHESRIDPLVRSEDPISPDSIQKQVAA